MLSKKVEQALNKQVEVESESSQFYLAMASWAETEGFGGTAAFMYRHSDEERQHMLKLVKFINERGGKTIIPALTKPEAKYKSIHQVFENLLKHEMDVTNQINEVVHICLQEKDYTTHNFMQWYVSEQIEEEALARAVMDQLRLVGKDGSGMYMFDRDILKISADSASEPGSA